ncbi:hypothetical protein SAMN06264364_13653 [Quadrisphaera granulorum]|uniref:Uncharacterized protein n=1 Tax=Quadrisphaera granulorum TaxID=317664 RepID=A0A315ZPW7_9ACTN|nr:hypothetical protein BXY45_13653 [Quadrisphaera granulorum]SZE98751.1 hypothetical protein SAMN06264364_13653 [Quadrisphaera granulorum]
MCLHRTPADFDDERRSGNARLLAFSRSARAVAAPDEEAY